MAITKIFVRFLCVLILIPIIPISITYAANDENDLVQNTQSIPSSENTTYQAVCSTCHDSGINKAPMIDDKINWQHRAHKGLSVLYLHVINGYNRMPPLGGCVTCTNEDIKAAVDYMLAANLTPDQFKSLNAHSKLNALPQSSPLTSISNPLTATITEQNQSVNNIKQNDEISSDIQKKYFATIMINGKNNYDRYCAGCHGVDGRGTTLSAPALRKGLYSSSHVTIENPISHHIEIVLQGVPNTVMMPYGQMLTDAQLASIITYTRNAWGNNTGDIVTEKDIQAERNLLKQNNKVSPNTDKIISYDDLMSQGKKNYEAYCARCHQSNGKGKAPFGPNLKNSFVAHDPELINHKIDKVLNGVPGTRMRGFGAQLTDAEIASILTYITNGWGEHDKQTVQPNDINTARRQLTNNAQSSDNNADKTMTFKELMSTGRIAYMANCARCHMPDGTGGAQPGVPSLLKSPITTGKSTIKNIDLVLTGVPGSIMRTFAPRLTNAEIAAIITYQRNAWGNNTGDMVQPSTIQNERIKLQKQIEYQTKHQLVQQYYREEKLNKNN